VTDAPDATAQNEVEMGHGTLIHDWARLRDWLSEDRPLLLMRDEISEVAEDWEAHQRDKNYLNHLGQRLEAAEALTIHPRFSLNSTERAYLDTCRAVQERTLTLQRRLRMGIVVGSIAAAVVAFALAGWAMIERGRAEEQRILAQVQRGQAQTAAATAEALSGIAVQQAANARIRALAAQTQLERDLGQDELAALLATEAYAEAERSGGEQRGLAISALSAAVDRPFFSRQLVTDSGGAASLAFSRDGGKLAAGGADGRVQLWDMMASPPARLREFPATKGRVWAVEFDSTGSALLTGDGVGDVKWWDLRDLQTQGESLPPPVELLASTGKAVRDIAFSPDGKYVAAGGYDGFVRLWRAEGFSDLGFSLVRTICPSANTDQAGSECPNSGQVLTLAFNHDGSLLAVGGDTGVVHIWNTENFMANPQVLPTQQGKVLAVLFHPTSNLLAVAGQTLAIELWDINNVIRPCATLQGHDEHVRNLAFTRDGSTLASGSEDETIRLWDIAYFNCTTARAPYSRGPLAVLGGSEEHIWALATSPTDRTLASTSRGGHVRLWDLGELGRERRVFTGHATWVHSVAFYPSQEGDSVACGPALASGDDDGAVRIWRQGGESEQIRAPDKKPIRAVAFSPPDGKWLAAAGHTGNVYVWNLSQPCEIGQHGEPVKLELGPSQPGFLIDLAFSPDGTRLAAAAQDGTIRVWKVSPNDPSDWPARILGTHEEIDEDDPTRCAANQHVEPTQMWSVAFSLEGDTIVAGDSDGAIHLFDVEDRKAESRLPTSHSDGISDLAFSTDGNRLASASCDRTVLLWDARFLQSGGDAPAAPEHALRGHEDAVRSVAFNPEGTRLASGSQDQTVRLWDLERLADGPTVLGHQEEWVRTVASSPDGRRLAASSADAAIRIWTVQSDELFQRACTIVSRSLSPEEQDQFLGSDNPHQPACQEVSSPDTTGSG
jgi:WD40 repeat protein